MNSKGIREIMPCLLSLFKDWHFTTSKKQPQRSAKTNSSRRQDQLIQPESKSQAIVFPWPDLPGPEKKVLRVAGGSSWCFHLQLVKLTVGSPGRWMGQDCSSCSLRLTGLVDCRNLIDQMQ